MVRRAARAHITLLLTVAVVLSTAAIGAASPWGDRANAGGLALMRADLPPTTAPPATTTTTAAPTTTTTTAAPTTTTTKPPPPPTTTAPPKPAQRFTFAPYSGLGAWIDVYDWSLSFGGAAPLGRGAIDQLAAQGVQTVYIQASKWDSPTEVLEPDRLMVFIERAHQHGISVVAWYLPTLEDVGRDIRRLLAIAKLPVDGLAVDLESRAVGDVAERSRRMVQLSGELRVALPGQVLGAIVLEPVLMEDVNPSYWPGYPWQGMATSYDVWLPMGYWTNRKASSPWRDAYTYTAANIDRVRHHIGRPDAPIHVIGGIGDKTSTTDLQRFRAAALERNVVGGSIYDFRTTVAPHWPELAPFRQLRAR